MYTVYVGGTEVNDYHIDDLADAEKWAEYWKSIGYDDVQIQEVEY